MLLPSAFPCNAPATLPTSKATRPKLASSSSISYQPIHPAQKAATSLLASCRALQAILGSAPPSPPPAPSLRQQPTPPPSALRHDWYPSPPPPPPRGLNKRRRTRFEQDQESWPEEALEEKGENVERIYVTPKRHRKAPLLIPRGLSAEDFDALEDAEQVSLPPFRPKTAQESTTTAAATTTDESWTSDDLELADWTAADDRLLVATVLEKLKLSKREWNDCARRLGRDKDTLGRRWKMLVVEGNVGLRRGGRRRRTDLDVESW